jgi:hypothetical protein
MASILDFSRSHARGRGVLDKGEACQPSDRDQPEYIVCLIAPDSSIRWG